MLELFAHYRVCIQCMRRLGTIALTTAMASGMAKILVADSKELFLNAKSIYWYILAFLLLS